MWSQIYAFTISHPGQRQVPPLVQNKKMYMDAKKLTNQKNYMMKSKEITEMEIAEIKKEWQEIQRSYVNGIESSCTL